MQFPDRFSGPDFRPGPFISDIPAAFASPARLGEPVQPAAHEVLNPEAEFVRLEPEETNYAAGVAAVRAASADQQPEAPTPGQEPSQPEKALPPENAQPAEPVTGPKGSPIMGEHVRNLRQKARTKIFFARKFIKDREEPVDPTGQEALKNVKAIDANVDRIELPNSPEYQQLKRYLTGPKKPDRFAIQEATEAFVASILDGTEKVDMVDVTLATIVAERTVARIANEATSSQLPRLTERFADFESGYELALVHAVDYENVFNDSVMPMADMYKNAASLSELSSHEAHVLDRTQRMATDRLELTNLIIGGGLGTRPNLSHEPNEYGLPSKPGELERLDARAADVIEKLQLIKAYGVRPMEVSAADTGLPWSMVLTPPFDLSSGVPEYAEGAIADFLIVDPGRPSTDMKVTYEQLPTGQTEIKFGDVLPRSRLRLHDNGQLSYGVTLHNVPNDGIAAVFDECSAKPALRRLRGLLIATASDALVPREVTQGTVAETLRRGRSSEPVERRIIDVLLQRNKVLDRAGVSERNPMPQGWEGPTQEIGGYVRRLPPGQHARPEAEAEARRYYEGINVEFKGLPQGHNFIKPYNTPIAAQAVIHRARFRNDSITNEFLRNLRGQ
jgi:hypothetical protein